MKISRKPTPPRADSSSSIIKAGHGLRRSPAESGYILGT